MAVLVTGAGGFIGEMLCEKLSEQGFGVCGIVRSSQLQKNIDQAVKVKNISSCTDWSEILVDIDQVVHLAARVHIMRDKHEDALSEYRRANVDTTLNLASQAASAGVKRFIFLSSIKVNGEQTYIGTPFKADDTPSPTDPYGVSKYEAEVGLRQLAIDTGMEVVIIRPPLVYGPGVKANFKSMMQLLNLGVPLPFAAITDNRRSLVALDNLVDLIITCLTNTSAANQTFLVSDGEDLSTAELLSRAACALGLATRLFYVPKVVLKLGAVLVRKIDIYQRLCGSLQVDIEKTKQLLGWIPPLSVDEGLRLLAKKEINETRV